MSDLAGGGLDRRTYTNVSAVPVLFPLGTVKVEVPPGQTLVYFNGVAGQDPFRAARLRRKLMAAAMPVLVVAAILAVGLLIVMYISLKGGAD